MAENSPDFVAKAFGYWASGAAVVVLRRQDDEQRLRVVPVSEVAAPKPGHGWFDARFESKGGDGIAQVCFTSGTEGEPKGVALTHENLADVVTRLNSVMQLTDAIREYVGVPVYHSFGFGRCRAVSQAGGRAFVPARGFNPAEINAMLEAGEINAISAVPSLWRVLLQTQAVTARAGRRVRWIEIGSQSMSAAEKRALAALFPEARIVQHYGLTEASRSTFLEIHDASDTQLESVGRAFGQVELRISAEGRIMIRGPHVATQMWVGGERVDPRDADGWLTTNDRGELRDGYLHYLGRADDMINCGGLKLAPDALEAGIRQKLGPSAEFTVCRIPNAIRGDGILIAATAALSVSDDELRGAALEAAAALGVNAGDATQVVRVGELPRTDTGKVKREELSKRFASLATAAPPSTRQLSGSAPLRQQLGRILGASGVRDQDTFVNLGGDSLRYIQAVVVLERALGYVPEAWEQLPMSELEALPARSNQGSRLEPAVMLRALAILSVVVNHTGVLDPYFAIDGAAFALLLPAGYSFARFQLQRVLDSGRAVQALTALPRVIVPTVLIVLLQQLRHGELVLSPLLLYNNFIQPPTRIFSYWFIEVFVQLHLLLALALSFRSVRAQLRARAYPTAVVATLVSGLSTLVAPLIWDTKHLANLLPHFALWYFLLGWCVWFGQSRRQRWLNSALIVGLPLLLLFGTSRSAWIIAGGLFINWAPALRLPTRLARGIAVIASASLYIYITHFFAIEPVAKVWPAGGFLAQVAAGIGSGIVLWFCFERLWEWSRRVRGAAGAIVPPTQV